MTRLLALALGLLMAAAATIASTGPGLAVVAIAGLAGAAYLVVRLAGGDDPVAALTVPTVLGALGLSAVTVLGATVPLGLPWVPLVAPLAVVAAYVIVLDRYVGDPGRGGPLR